MTVGHHTRLTYDHGVRPTPFRKAPILIAMMGIGALFGYATFSSHFAGFSGAVRCTAPDPPSTAGAPTQQGSQSDAVSQSAVARALSGAPQPLRPRTLDRLVAHLTRKPLTPARAAYLMRVLQELADGGTASVPTIADFLRRGADVDLVALGASELVGERTLRQALLTTLLTIGGSDAMAVAGEQLQQTRQPIETAILARGLEADAPGAHTDAILQAIDDTLAWARDARESPDLAPLFDLLRTYGGARAVSLLERSVPLWGEYAVIALAELPDSAGIPALTSLAGAENAPLENHALAFQALAQATTRAPAAADALLDLARADRIPEEAWNALADALGGKHLQFSRTMLDGTPLTDPRARTPGERGSAWRSYYIEWLNVRYEQDVVTADWSPADVQRQLALIDDLLQATSNPVATAALQRARGALL